MLEQIEDAEQARLEGLRESATQLQNRIMAYLTPNGHRIGQEAREGSIPAIEVIDAYKFVHACPGDTVAWILLDQKLKTYLNDDLTYLTKGV